MAKVTFRLNGEDTPLSWTVPQDGAMALKGDARKYINYYPGQDSIYTEDITNKDIRFTKVPDFVYNPLSKHTELTFDDSDKALLNYLTNHPWHNKKWKVFSKALEAAEKLSKYDKVDTALSYIKDSDELKIKANAIAVFGLHYYYKTTEECAVALKDKALHNPEVITNSFEAPDYEARFLASLAFCTGVVKNNFTSTAVVWDDANEGIIVHVAKGENGIDKLTEVLAVTSKESETLQQEFHNRIKKISSKSLSPKEAKATIDAKDAQIAELQRKLEAMTKKTEPLTSDEIADMDLDAARAAYEARIKPVPIVKKNDLDWIKAQLTGA